MDKIYLSTPSKIAILDHEKKRTFVVRKEGLPDAGKKFRSLFCFSFCFPVLFPRDIPPCVFQVLLVLVPPFKIFTLPKGFSISNIFYFSIWEDKYPRKVKFSIEELIFRKHHSL